MERIAIGSSDLSTSRLAYGCWRIAPLENDKENLPLARRAVLAAVEAGYTLFDHADIYCRGRAEAVFGEILRENPGLREKVVVATKCGIRFADEPAGAPARYDSSAEHIVRSCEGSLRRLGVECIDFYQIHRPDPLMDPEEVARAFDQLYAAGKVREFGVSNFRTDQVEMLQRACARPIQANQVEVSLLQLASFDDGVLSQCVARRMTPLAWSPLGAGLLGDGGVDLLPGQRGYRPSAVAAVLDRIASAVGVQRTTVALAWLLKHPARIVPILGSTDPERIRGAVAAASMELTREQWYELYVAGRGAPLP
jgi:predicted oxidoreductase